MYTNSQKHDENIEYKTFDFELMESKVKTEDDQELGIFSGAMASQNKDLGDDIIAANAFDNTLKKKIKSKKQIPILYQHDSYQLPVGGINPKNVIQDGKKWMVKGELNLDTPMGASMYALMKQGVLSDMSIGYYVVDADMSRAGIRTIKELELREVSIVITPMNKDATVDHIKSAGNIEYTTVINFDNEIKVLRKFDVEDVEVTSKKDFEEILRESGIFSRKAATYLASLININCLKQSDSDNKTRLFNILDELSQTIKKIK